MGSETVTPFSKASVSEKQQNPVHDSEPKTEFCKLNFLRVCFVCACMCVCACVCVSERAGARLVSYMLCTCECVCVCVCVGGGGG